MAGCGSHIRYEVKCSYLQIYNGSITDLLAPDPQAKLILRTPPSGPFVEGLSEKVVLNEKAALELMERGAAHRRVRKTERNDDSSRSHSVFTLQVVRTDADPTSGTSKVQHGKLQLVDLAGSEQSSVADATTETSRINQTLLALRTVIRKLKQGKAQIPYRDSKLTFLLKDALGGNSQTVMIANVSPCAKHIKETRGTLQFATEARCVRNTTHVNTLTSGSNQVLQARVRQLEAALNAWEDRQLEVKLVDLERQLDVCRHQAVETHVQLEETRDVEEERYQLFNQLAAAQTYVAQLEEKLQAQEAEARAAQENTAAKLLHLRTQHKTVAAALAVASQASLSHHNAEEIAVRECNAMHAKEITCMRAALELQLTDAAAQLAAVAAATHSKHKEELAALKAQWAAEVAESAAAAAATDSKQKEELNGLELSSAEEIAADKEELAAVQEQCAAEIAAVKVQCAAKVAEVEANRSLELASLQGQLETVQAAAEEECTCKALGSPLNAALKVDLPEEELSAATSMRLPTPDQESSDTAPGHAPLEAVVLHLKVEQLHDATCSHGAAARIDTSASVATGDNAESATASCVADVSSTATPLGEAAASCSVLGRLDPASECHRQLTDSSTDVACLQAQGSPCLQPNRGVGGVLDDTPEHSELLLAQPGVFVAHQGREEREGTADPWSVRVRKPHAQRRTAAATHNTVGSNISFGAELSSGEESEYDGDEQDLSYSDVPEAYALDAASMSPSESSELSPVAVQRSPVATACSSPECEDEVVYVRDSSAEKDAYVSSSDDDGDSDVEVWSTPYIDPDYTPPSCPRWLPLRPHSPEF